MKYKKIATISASAATALLVAACGMGTIDATIGGTVNGLSGGTTVTLVDNGTDPITVSTTDTFSFDVQIASGSNYNVTVMTQPIGETCAVVNGSGTVDSSGDPVSNVVVNCSANLSSNNTVLGSVSGLQSGNSVSLLDNNADPVTVSTNGAFVFPSGLAAGAVYNVTIAANPVGQTCTLTNASGTMPSSGSIATILVACS
jgi:hypothetical protein